MKIEYELGSDGIDPDVVNPRLRIGDKWPMSMFVQAYLRVFSKYKMRARLRRRHVSTPN